MIAFIGVRISWLIAARKLLLARFASSACCRAASASWNSRASSMAAAACWDRLVKKSRSAAENRVEPEVGQTHRSPHTMIMASATVIGDRDGQQLRDEGVIEWP